MKDWRWPTRVLCLHESNHSSFDEDNERVEKGRTELSRTNGRPGVFISYLWFVPSVLFSSWIIVGWLMQNGLAFSRWLLADDFSLVRSKRCLEVMSELTLFNSVPLMMLFEKPGADLWYVLICSELVNLISTIPPKLNLTSLVDWPNREENATQVRSDSHRSSLLFKALRKSTDGGTFFFSSRGLLTCLWHGYDMIHFKPHSLKNHRE